MIMILICTSIRINFQSKVWSVPMYVCICNAVTENQIRQAIAEGAETVVQLREKLAVTGTCGMCIETVMEYLQTPALPQQS